MREIKFRGKRIDNGEWAYGCYVKWFMNYDFTRTRDAIIYYTKNPVVITPIIYVVEIIPETLGQFTGLLDKNGKEIYEGDKCIEREELRNPRTREPYKKLRYITREGIIVFHDGTFDFKSERYQGQVRCFASTPRRSGVELEIIGNIHEAKE